IVPDLPLEEAGEVIEALGSAGLPLVLLVAPTTPRERRRRICERAQGFVYVVSDTRVTGERDELPEGLGELVAAVRAESRAPVAVGFGIGSPEQAAAVGRIADGVIIGSRLVRAVAEADGASAVRESVVAFLRDCRAALSG
ncbi:MAG TPA: tryptophan synthase subunit alpha, partial [Solirubrobacterales bacterium]|nr:tryptophan synthase subunit alpha [Solirubrobacterales bacterium]